MLIHEGHTKDHVDTDHPFRYKLECSDKSLELTLSLDSGKNYVGHITEWFKCYKEQPHPRLVTINDLYETIISAFEKCDGVTWALVEPIGTQKHTHCYLLIWVDDKDCHHFTVSFDLWEKLN